VEPRIKWAEVAPQVASKVGQLEAYATHSGLEASLLELVRLRASYLNGCAYCIDMHTKDARASGESEQRLYAVPLWRETPFFTPRERAALAWTEAVTLIAGGYVPDEAYREAREQFGEKELVDLTVAIIAINSWNRLSVAFRTVPGSYQPGQHAGAATRPGPA
jgi:AhpD family alkylhydroperoxidase